MLPAAHAWALRGAVSDGTAATGTSTVGDAAAAQDVAWTTDESARDQVARAVNRPDAASSRTAGDVDADPVVEVGHPDEDVLFDL